MNHAQTELESAKEAEFTAYINELAEGNPELIALLESDRDGVRADIEGMREANANDLGKALAYFGGGVELGNTTELT